MFSRKILFPVVLATVAGMPYLLHDQNWMQTAKGAFHSAVSGIFSAGVRPPPQFPSEFSYGPRAENPRLQVDAGLTGTPVSDLGEVLRMDVSPQWVTLRWPRVTTVLAEVGLEGLRVPLMTGTRVDDLAGTLTYYFDRNQQVQRLAFDGFTGDERRLLGLVTQAYGLAPEPTLDAGILVARWNGRPTSLVRVARAPIVTLDSPHARLRVQMELNRPSAYYGLSAEFVQRLQGDRTTQRW